MNRGWWNAVVGLALVMSPLGLQSALAQWAGHHHHGHHHHHHGASWGQTRVFQYGYSYGPIWYQAGWAYGPSYVPPWYSDAPGWNYGPNYLGPYAPYVPGGYVLPPSFVPAETLYGPQAVQRFMGVGASLPPAPVTLAAPTSVAPTPAPPPAKREGFGVLAGDDKPLVAVAKPRASNDAARNRAYELIRAGDEQFRRGKYHFALSRYKDAAGNAPDLAEAPLREGLTLAAMGQYDVAVRVLRRGLELKPDWPRSGFELKTLYGDDPAGWLSVRAALEQAIAQRPLDPHPQFILGLHEHFFGRPLEARAALDKARSLALGDDLHIQALLDALPHILPPQVAAGPPR